MCSSWRGSDATVVFVGRDAALWLLLLMAMIPQANRALDEKTVTVWPVKYIARVLLRMKNACPLLPG
jgi:hypothetical protein